MTLEDIRLKESIDLVERARAIRDDLIPELDSRITEAEAAIEDDDADDPEHDPRNLRDLKDTLTGQARACDRVADALDAPDECVFVLQELMTSETALLTDNVSEQSLDVDVETEEVDATIKQGYHKVRTLELSIVDAPAEMPSRFDNEVGREVYLVGDLPDHVTNYLYKCELALNDAGEVDGVGNLSTYGVQPAAE